MSQEDIFAKLKKDVCSLLLSSKMGLDPAQLQQDYINMLGHPMPLKFLGFRNIMDMAKEMPDAVSVNYRADGSPYFKAVSNEATRNIEELVANQRMSKSDKAKNRGFNHFYPLYHHHHRFTPVVLPRRGHAPPALPAHLRMQLRLLLSQGPVMLSHIENCYLRCFGYPLWVHNYGFYSTGEMLEAARDMILIQQSRFGSVLTLREHMIPRPVMKPVNLTRTTGPMQPGYLLSSMPVSNGANMKNPEPTKPSAEVVVKESPVSQPSEASLGPDQEEPAVSIKNEMNEKVRETKSVDDPDSEHFQKLLRKLEEELRQQILENGVAGTVSQELKDKLRKVVAQTSGGLSVHDLPAEYKKRFGEDLPYAESGFVSVTELIDALRDTFRLEPAEDDSGRHWIVRDIKDCEDSQSDSKETAGSSEGKLAAKGSYVSSGGSPWENEHGGNDGADDEEEELEPSITSKPEKMTVEMYTAIQVHGKSTMPLDAVKSQRLKPPTRHGTRELVQVLVELVVSPGSFYIRFSESKEARALEDMMLEMRQCYTCPEVSERYRLPQPFIRLGQVCCVSPKGIWFYRVVIHRLLNPTQVEVYYVDYGNVTVVQSSSLKFLKLSFSVLPAQAVPSSLAGIKPTSVNWTPEATVSFQKLCSDRTLVGALDCYSADVLQLYLCDTHTDQDVYVHSVLIQQGHGVACSPAAAAALCVQVTPVSLYFGEGIVDLPEVDKELLLSSDTFEPSMEGTQVEDEGPPGLELIEENEVIPRLQEMGANPFFALLDTQTFSSSELSSANESPSTRPALTTLGPPDSLQTRKNSPLREAEPKTENATPSSSDLTSCCPQEEAQPDASDDSSLKQISILRTLMTNTPHVKRVQDSPQDTTHALVFPSYQRKPGFLFPLFGTSQIVSVTATPPPGRKRCTLFASRNQLQQSFGLS